MITVMMPKKDILAGGIWKEFDRRRSMVRACCVLKLPLCEFAVTSKIPAAQTGSNLRKDFSSSTRCTVASFHRFGVLEAVASPYFSTAALSSHLQSEKASLEIFMQQI
jgi:hypothetical protein